MDVTERRLAEEALRGSEEKYYALFDQAADAIIVFDPEKNALVDYNERLYQNLGYSREEFDGLSITDFEVLESSVDVARHVEEILNKGTDIFETKHRKKNGDICDILVSSRVLTIGGKKYLQSIFRDITEMKHAETSLRESEKKNKQINRLMEKLLKSATLEQKLRIVTEGIVEIFDAEFCRIWIIMPGDRCQSGCFHSNASEDNDVCLSRENCLHLMVSSGCYTHNNGEVHSRIPIGKKKIGRIASGDEINTLTNDILTDPHIEDPFWAKKLELCSFAGYQLLSDDGKPVGVLALFSKRMISPMDDTLLKGLSNSIAHVIQTVKAETALMQSRSFLNATGKMAKVGGWELDTNTLEVNWTEQTYRIFELPLDYLPHHGSGINFIYPDDREKVATAVQHALNQGVPYDLEHRLITAKGNELWARTICNPQIVNGKIVKLKGTFQDITDLKKAEKALKESENRYRSMIEFSPLGIGIVNTDGVIVKLNQTLATILGYEVEDLVGINGAEGLTHPEDIIKEKKFLKPLFSGEIISYNLEKRFRHKNGEYYWYNVTVAKMMGSSGDEAFLLGFIEDINDRKQLEQERENLINNLQKALAEIKELRGFFPICAKCKKIRDDKGYWQQVEKYIMDRTDAQFSHGLCPDCVRELYPDIAEKVLEKQGPST